MDLMDRSAGRGGLQWDEVGRGQVGQGRVEVGRSGQVGVGRVTAGQWPYICTKCDLT